MRSSLWFFIWETDAQNLDLQQMRTLRVCWKHGKITMLLHFILFLWRSIDEKAAYVYWIWFFFSSLGVQRVATFCQSTHEHLQREGQWRGSGESGGPWGATRPKLKFLQPVSCVLSGAELQSQRQNLLLLGASSLFCFDFLWQQVLLMEQIYI